MSKPEKEAEKQARLAAKLRENLRKRKQQVRGRDSVDSGDAKGRE
ncbi:hypothetical protein [Aestuariispira ectoiniformans]|nr:hypothetical protein [Aestuariispira ectoiniformans]